MKPWPHATETEEIKIGWRYLVRKVFTDPAGKEQEYYTKEKLDSIAIATVALTPDNKVIVAEQFRPGPEQILQELPGGGHNPGETLEQAARRELHEETGYTPGTMEYLGKIYKDAYTNMEWHYFLARDCTLDGGQHTDEGEFITVKEISISQLFENIKQSKMTDTDAIALAYETLKELEGVK